jgi:hypothetical protein
VFQKFESADDIKAIVEDEKRHFSKNKEALAQYSADIKKSWKEFEKSVDQIEETPVVVSDTPPTVPQNSMFSDMKDEYVTEVKATLGEELLDRLSQQEMSLTI